MHVEHDSIIAAGTLLTEGTRIPAGSLVMGRPGKVKRPLNEEELAEIRRLSQRLRELPARLLAGRGRRHQADGRQ